MKESEYDQIPQRPTPAANPATPATQTPATPAPAAPPPVVPTNEPKTYEHPRTLIRRAMEFGASISDVRHTTPDDLDLWIEAQESAARQKPATPPVVDADEYGIGELVKSNPEFESPLLAVVKKIAEKTTARLGAIETENKALKSEVTRLRGAKNVDAIDEVFSGLSPAIFGAGGRASIDPNSAEGKRRLSVISTAGIKKGDSDAVVKQKIKANADLLYPAAAPATPSNGVPPATPRISPEDWNNGGLKKPTSRATNEPDGVNKAYRAVQELMIEKGMFDEEDMPLKGVPE